MDNRDISIDINVAVQFSLDGPDAPVSIYEWTAHAYESSPSPAGSAISAASLMEWEPKQVAYVCGRLLYLSEIDKIEVGDGAEADMERMANAVWDWSGCKPRDPSVFEEARLLTIDRLQVPAELRGCGYGRRVVLELLRQYPHTMVSAIPVADGGTTSAQQHLLAFLSRLGFAPAASDPGVYWLAT